ncbi:unnamed protein product [Symbiodinium sp. CCMP2592]|nr:unnamed protein product [Symbiodinium sp. CCMP2592]
MLHECIFFLAQSETIRFRTLQCFMLNGVIFLGSILLFNFAIEPALGILRRLVQEEEVWATEFIATSFSFLYKILWIYPIYCISFVLNTVMYQEIADSALAFAQCTPTKATPHLERLIQETWRVLVNLVYLLEMYLVTASFLGLLSVKILKSSPRHWVRVVWRATGTPHKSRRRYMLLHSASL